MQYVHVIRRSLLIAPVQAVGSQRCTAWFVYLQARSYGGIQGQFLPNFCCDPNFCCAQKKFI